MIEVAKHSYAVILEKGVLCCKQNGSITSF